MWGIIIIVCIIFGIISQPIDRIIKNRVSSKGLSISLELVIYFIIFMAIYGIALLFGFNL